MSPRADTVDDILLPAAKAIELKGAMGVVIRSTGTSTVVRTSRSVEPSSKARFRGGGDVEEDPFSPKARSPRFDAMGAIRESMVPVAPPKVGDVVAVQSPRVVNRHKGRK